TVTGAMTRVDLGRTSLLVDCGAPQGRDAGSFAGIAEARDVDAVVLTHGHADHVGSLPALFDAGFGGHIHGTRATLDLAEINVRDGLRLAGASDHELRRFVAAYRKRLRPLRYDAPLVLRDVELTLRDAGHILG